LSGIELVAVITAPSRRKPLPVAASSTQEELFHSELPPNTRPN
jgi:hypothetical protein